MARRSNKTAHVLNLIAGHEAQKEETEEVVSSGAAEAPASADAGQPAPAPSAPSAQNIAVIDTTEKDPVADLIQQKLSDVLEEERPGSAAPAQPEVQTVAAAQAGTAAQTAAAEPSVQADTAAQVTAAIRPADKPLAQTDTTARTEAHTQPVSDAPAQTDTSAQAEAPAWTAADTPARTDTAAQTADSPETPAAEPEPEPEPSFAAVNVMERIVHDKIIYYMRQFEVCTCDRCVADTIALTLNGLMPKYIVTMPAAVDPLLSYYTNRLISDVTVEATKACMIVKENPRH